MGEGIGQRVLPLVLEFALLAALMPDALGAERESGSPLGLTCGEDGQVLLRGKPFRGIGMQYQDPFQRRLKDPDDTSYREGFAELASYEVPFVRFMACGFWPKEMKLYLEDRETYFSFMDDVVATAERNGVGLIPSFFWWYACVPDLVGEPINQWGNPESKTHEFMRTYTKELVTRYKDSPAIWAWEFGNEYNLPMDLPNAKEHLPWVHPHLGTPDSRSEKDTLTFEMVQTALKVFAETVRRYDPHRLVISGNSMPRASSHHQRTELSWGRDTRAQFVAHLKDINPSPLDSVSVHLYPHHKKERYFQRETLEYEDLLTAALEAARAEGKVLFVGEFGAQDDEKHGGRELARVENEKLFKALAASNVPLAAYWVYDFSWQDSFINVTSTNHRSYVLDMVRDANRQMK